jgi:hypothetical protein
MIVTSQAQATQSAASNAQMNNAQPVAPFIACALEFHPAQDVLEKLPGGLHSPRPAPYPIGEPGERLFRDQLPFDYFSGPQNRLQSDFEIGFDLVEDV